MCIPAKSCNFSSGCSRCTVVALLPKSNQKIPGSKFSSADQIFQKNWSTRIIFSEKLGLGPKFLEDQNFPDSPALQGHRHYDDQAPSPPGEVPTKHLQHEGAETPTSTHAQVGPTAGAPGPARPPGAMQGRCENYRRAHSQWATHASKVSPGKDIYNVPLHVAAPMESDQSVHGRNPSTLFTQAKGTPFAPGDHTSSSTEGVYWGGPSLGPIKACEEN